MKRSHRDRLLLTASVGLILAAGLWWHQSAEYENRLVPGPENPKLRTERFHVAGRWLARNDHETVSLNQLQDQFLEPPEGATLIAAAPLGLQNRLESIQLHDWILEGGHLIAQAPQRVGRQSSAITLNPFEIVNCRTCGSGEEQDSAESSEENLPDDSRTRLHTPDGQAFEIWQSAFLDAGEHEGALELWRDEHDQVLVARHALGEGRITLLPDIGWLDNEHLIYPGHARLLLALVDSDRERVYLQQRAGGGGLLGWLWRQAPALWLTALLLGALGIWSRMPRMGPLAEPGHNRSTQIREHLLATARFDWHHNLARNLIAAMREERRNRCMQRYPDWRRLDLQTQASRLAALCPDRSKAQMEWLLAADALPQPEHLITYVNLHNRLMHAL